MPPPVENARDHLRLLARLMWRPGALRELDLSDVVQQTLLKAHKNGHQYRGGTEAEWRGWLRTILLNELRQAAKGNRAFLRSLDESSRALEEVAGEQTSPSQRVVRAEQLEQLAAALSKLPDHERTAVELKHLHSCTMEVISQHLGRTKQATAGVLKRGMRRLREILNAPPEGVTS
jgi:RNA polymerase sigma-70 factor (ECF subfamily)